MPKKSSKISVSDSEESTGSITETQNNSNSDDELNEAKKQFSGSKKTSKKETISKKKAEILSDDSDKEDVVKSYKKKIRKKPVGAEFINDDQLNTEDNEKFENTDDEELDSAEVKELTLLDLKKNYSSIISENLNVVSKISEIIKNISATKYADLTLMEKESLNKNFIKIINLFYAISKNLDLSEDPKLKNALKKFSK